MPTSLAMCNYCYDIYSSQCLNFRFCKMQSTYTINVNFFRITYCRLQRETANVFIEKFIS